ncbi:hypothetical protein ACFPM0_29520 [Pseudonocardia sulfidoxydans]|uniref:hypothetical protein n=1 Tax=Pseudonocardia sulfidoxydans TaxID=54011 RepID=UPI003609474A
MSGNSRQGDYCHSRLLSLLDRATRHQPTAAQGPRRPRRGEAAGASHGSREWRWSL